MKRLTTHQGAHVAHYANKDLGSWERDVDNGGEFSSLTVFTCAPPLLATFTRYTEVI